MGSGALDPGQEVEVLDWLAPTPTAGGANPGSGGGFSPAALDRLEKELAGKDRELEDAKSRIQSHRQEVPLTPTPTGPCCTVDLNPNRDCNRTVYP
jgi:hypothetical protein